MLRLPDLVTAALLASLSAVHAASVVNVTNHGAVPNSGQDATPAFKLAIAAASAASKPVTLLVPPGRYDFFSTQATKRNCYFSNATEPGIPMRTIALDIADINDLTIFAEGATLMMRGKMTMMTVERCERFTVRGATFDFARPTVSEITCQEKGADYWIGSVHPDSTYQIQGGTIRWVGEDWNSTHNLVQPYDPVTRTTWRGGDPTSGASSIQDLGNRRLRFNVGASSLGNAVIGLSYQFRNTLRDETGIWFNRSKDVSLEDVDVRFMHGFGILGQFTENLNFSRLNVAPDPASGRTCAAAADILHFSNCKGLIRVHDSALTAAHDDAVNIHGTHLRIVGTPAPNKITVRFMQPQSWGFQAYQPGDQIEFVRGDTLLAHATRTVTAVDFTPGSYEQTLTLNSPNPAGITLNSDIVENITWNPAAEFVNCDIALIPTRGFLLTTRQGVLVEGCRFFRTQMHAILCEGDGVSWFESGPMRGLTLRRNSFFECAESVVQISPNVSSYGGAVHSNVVIQWNDFTLKGNSAVYANATAGLTVTGNRFRIRDNTTPSQASLVVTNNTTGLQVTGNTLEAATTPALAVANGGFETPDVAANATGVPGSWFTSGGAVILGEGFAAGNPASQLLSLDPGAAAWQVLGPFDPAQGGFFNWSLRQCGRLDPAAASGEMEVGFFAWNGVYDPASGRPSASGMTRLGKAIVVTTLGSRPRRIVRGSLDLTGTPGGTRVWLEIRATGTSAALFDDVTASSAAVARALSYDAWATEAGLSAADAVPSADPEGDGLENQLEYALEGCDPYSFDPMPLTSAAAAAPFLAWSFTPRPGTSVDLRSQYQIGSLAAGGWQNVVDGQDGIFLTHGHGSWFVETDPSQHSRAFFRLGALLPPIVPGLPLQVTGGDFGTTDSQGSQTPDWFESSAANWVEGTWMNGFSFPTAFPSSEGAALLMDNLGDGSYVYQKLGVLEQAHIDLGTLRLTADFIEKPDGTTNSARFDVFAGSFPGAADGNDIFNAGLTNIGSFVIAPAAQGLTAESGNQGRANAVLAGNVSLLGLSPGSDIWLRITDAADGLDDSGSGGDLMLDNVKAEVAQAW